MKTAYSDNSKPVLISSLLLLLGACTNVITPQSNEIDFGEQPLVWSSYLDSGDASHFQLNEAWWESFNEPTLNSLIDQAINENIDLEIARERVSEARLRAAISLSEFDPRVSINSSVANQRQSETSVLPVGRVPDFEADNTIYSAGFDASWEIDLFGRKKLTKDISDAKIQSQQELQRDITLTVVAEIARNYFDLRAALIEAETVKKNLSNQQELLQLTQSRRDYGEASDLDVETVSIMVEEYKSLLPELEVQVRVSEINLGILTGKPPAVRAASIKEPGSLPDGPVTAPLGLTSDLLRRRPDVRLAERDYVLAAREVDAAKIALYPQFSLFGSIGTETVDLSDLLNSRSIVSNVGALVSWSLYDGGRLDRETELSESNLRQAELSYTRSVLAALADVEIAATNYLSARQTQQRRQATVDSRVRLTEIAQQRFDAGVSTLLDVSNAEKDLGDASLSLIRVESQKLDALIALYKALGGGWQTIEAADDEESGREIASGL